MKKTLVWAHRGASAYAPENTLAAFQKAADMGADGIELDVQRTKDGVLVVIHDETVDRVSGQTGWVKDFTYRQLRNVNVNRKFPQYGSQSVPALEEVYEWAAAAGLTVNVELKTGLVFYPGMEAEVLELTEKYGMQKRVLYSSFNHYSLRRIRSLNPEAQTGVLYSDGIIGAAEYAGQTVQADALHPSFSNVQYPDFFEESRRHGLRVHVWTVDDEKSIRYLCGKQVDAVITNDPELARRAADERE